MQHISLLPPEIRQKRLAERRQGKLLLMLLIILVIIVAANAFLLANSFLVRSNLDAIKNDKDMVERQIGELAEYETLYQDLIRTEKLIDLVISDEPLWGSLLGGIGQNLPIGTQLADLRASYSNQSGSLSITGSTFSHDNLARLLEQLDRMEELDQVQCRVSTETTLNGRAAVQFQIESMLLGGPGYFPQSEEDE